MTQQSTYNHMSQYIDPDKAINLKNDLVWPDTTPAVESIEKLLEEICWPLTKALSNKASMPRANVQIWARRYFKYSHGIKYSARGAVKRPWQRVKYTGCEVR